MKKTILLIIYLCSGTLVFAQNEYRWPYFKTVPRYIGVTGGYEGLKTNNFQAGVVLNVVNLAVSPPVGAMIGGGLFYKQNIASSKVYAYEAEIGCYGGITVGVNYNYNVTTSNRLHGFKPFVGIALFNAQVFYGYSFYKSADDIHNELRHNRITIRYVIPLIKIQKKSVK